MLAFFQPPSKVHPKQLTADTDFCLGCNWLHNVRPDREDKCTEPDIPSGERVWSWLILCDDSMDTKLLFRTSISKSDQSPETVISMYEDPFANLDQDSRASQDATRLRRNLLNVFVQLSKVTKPSTRNPISLVPIRHLETSLSDSNDPSDPLAQPDSEIDGPGLLFYYLFDDWYATYALLAKEEHHYGNELNKLVSEVHSAAQKRRSKDANSLP